MLRYLIFFSSALISFVICKHGKIPNYCSEPTPPAGVQPKPRPKITSQFSAHIQCVIMNKNLTTDIHEYFDSVGNRGAVKQLYDGLELDAWYSYNTNEFITYYAPTGQCLVQTLSTSDQRFLFGYQPQGATGRIFSAAQMFHLQGQGVVDVYMGVTKVRNIAVDMWQSCQYWDAFDATMVVKWYFTATGKSEWDTAMGVPVPVAIRVTGRSYNASDKPHDFDHWYEFFHFRPDFNNSKQFEYQIPAGVQCPGRKNTKDLPTIPNTFSFMSEIVDKQMKTLSYIKEFYNYDEKVAMYQYRPLASQKSRYGTNDLMEIHDFNTGVAYITDIVHGNCTATKIDLTFDGRQVDKNHVTMMDPREFFHFDQIHFTYEGIDTWVEVNTGNAQGGTPVRLVIDAPDINFHYEYNIYNFAMNEPDILNFDISKCYIQGNRTRFQLSFPGDFKSAVYGNLEMFRYYILRSLTQYLKISALRISNLHVYQSMKDLIVDFTLLDVAPLYGNIQNPKAETPLATASGTLRDLVKNGQFAVSLDPTYFPNTPAMVANPTDVVETMYIHHNKSQTSVIPDIKCPSSFPNGNVSKSCSREISSQCSYQCNSGFNKTGITKYLHCLASGTWDITLADLCIRVTCPSSISNGNLSKACTAVAGAQCFFTCNEGYKKKEGVTSLNCSSNGQWNADSNNVCISTPVTCPSLISNGNLSQTCTAVAGAQCLFTCNEGYRKKEGVASLRCLSNGQWNIDSNSVCISIRVTCPSSISNGNLSKACTAVAGAQCFFTCNEGYKKKEGVTSLNCSSNGQWNADSNNVCISTPVTCPSLISNGNLSQTCTAVAGAQCLFTCNEGYRKKEGVASLRCLSNGQWNIDSNSVCISIQVTCPSSISNGNLSKACKAVAGAQCYFTCNEGYKKKEGVTSLNCSSNGQWNADSNNVCISTVVTCPSFISNGNLSQTCTAVAGAQCLFTCNEGYRKKEGVASLRCLSNGQWNIDSNSVCINTLVICPSLISNGNLSQTCTAVAGAQCLFTCNEGYRKKEGVTSLRCLSNGQWNTDFNRVCIKNGQCTDVIPRGTLDKCQPLVGEQCRYTCDKGYKKKNQMATFITCLNSGQWDRSEDTLCVEANEGTLVTCPSSISNGNLSKACTAVAGAQCFFTCNEGYRKKEGVTSLNCSSNGQWNTDSNNVCIKNGQCTDVIPWGKLDKCLPMFGEQCRYTCDKGYKKKNEMVTFITCLNSGQWDRSEDTLCVEANEGTLVTCPSSISNGNLSKACTAVAGAQCFFTCNEGYRKKEGVTSLNCSSNGQWNADSNNVCIKTKLHSQIVHEGYIKNQGVTSLRCLSNGQWNTDFNRVCIKNGQCTDVIPRGKLDTCQPLFGEQCRYTCDKGYKKKNEMVTFITCLNSGQWDRSEDTLCVEANEETSESRSDESRSRSNKAAIAGGSVGGVLLLIVIIVIAAILYIRHRNHSIYKDKTEGDTSHVFNVPGSVYEESR